MPAPDAPLTGNELLGSQHSYGIITDVIGISAGRVRLRAGTLYTALDRRRAGGLIEVEREEIVDSRLRRYYRLTPVGSERLAEETARLQSNASVAMTRLDLRLRAPVPDDAPGVLAVLIARDIADLAAPDCTLEDLRDEWRAGEFDLSADAQVVQLSDGQIVGYARSARRERSRSSPRSSRAGVSAFACCSGPSGVSASSAASAIGSGSPPKIDARSNCCAPPGTPTSAAISGWSARFLEARVWPRCRSDVSCEHLTWVAMLRPSTRWTRPALPPTPTIGLSRLGRFAMSASGHTIWTVS
jgi:DNA-binding PadR family transcriptional regulator